MPKSVLIYFSCLARVFWNSSSFSASTFFDLEGLDALVDLEDDISDCTRIDKLILRPFAFE